jgi:CBS domain-containing protein
MSIPVSKIMQRNIITIESLDTITTAARTMVKHSISCLLVIEKGLARGIITEQDLVTRIVAARQDPNKVRVKDIMSEPLIVVNQNMYIEEAARIMVQNGIRKLPIIERTDEGPFLIGLVSLMDIARLQPELLDQFKMNNNLNDIDEIPVDIS